MLLKRATGNRQPTDECPFLARSFTREDSMNELNGKRIAIIVTDGFEQIEMTGPREALEKAGARCALIAPKDGEVQGFKHHDKADKFKVDMTLTKADPSQF